MSPVTSEGSPEPFESEFNYFDLPGYLRDADPYVPGFTPGYAPHAPTFLTSSEEEDPLEDPNWKDFEETMSVDYTLHLWP